MDNMKRTFLNAAWYLAAFLLLQFAVMMLFALVRQTASVTPAVSIAITIISNVAVIALFAWRRWCPCDGSYINRRQWFTLFWVVCLTAGCILPLSFISDELGFKLPKEYADLFASIMSRDLGFIAVGVVAPVAEEMVFRGAILRTLYKALGHRRRWVAIAVSAVLFGLVHGNMAQGFGAAVMGLLLGWIYVRTGSIVPGVVFHWVNNSLAVMAYRAMPQAADMTLVEYFHGDMKYVAIALGCSLMIFGAALYQLRLRLN